MAKPAAGKAPAPKASESNEQKLIRLANKRVGKALKAIALCGNLGSYGPKPGQAQAIKQALEQGVRAAGLRIDQKTTVSGGFAIPTE